MATEASHYGADTNPSFWQRGCDDAKAGRQPSIPLPLSSNWRDNAANEGYMNGYKFGKTLRYQPAEDEGSQP